MAVTAQRISDNLGKALSAHAADKARQSACTCCGRDLDGFPDPGLRPAYQSALGRQESLTFHPSFGIAAEGVRVCLSCYQSKVFPAIQAAVLRNSPTPMMNEKGDVLMAETDARSIIEKSAAALRSPTVHAFLQMHTHGRMSLAEALAHTVVMLCEQNESLGKAALAAEQRKTPIELRIPSDPDFRKWLDAKAAIIRSQADLDALAEDYGPCDEVEFEPIQGGQPITDHWEGKPADIKADIAAVSERAKRETGYPVAAVNGQPIDVCPGCGCLPGEHHKSACSTLDAAVSRLVAMAQDGDADTFYLPGKDGTRGIVPKDGTYAVTTGPDTTVVRMKAGDVLEATTVRKPLPIPILCPKCDKLLATTDGRQVQNEIGSGTLSGIEVELVCPCGGRKTWRPTA